MSDGERIEEVEVVIARAGPPMGGNDAGALILGELGELRRRLDFQRLLLGALLAIAAVCLALLLVIAGRGM